MGKRICPKRPIIVIDGPDADGSNNAVCSALWSTRTCQLGSKDALIRVSGSAPSILSELAHGLRRSECRRFPPTPYLSHSRSPRAAHFESTDVYAPRPLRVAYAAASWGHVDADAHGFLAWRKALRNACKEEFRIDPARCKWAWVSMSGNGAEKAMLQYWQADFCLQPPGDTLARQGIIDSISLGCIPVLFHPAQVTLWPEHWNGKESSILFDWTGGAPRPLRKNHSLYSDRAKYAMEQLRLLPNSELARLREGVEIAARRVTYGWDEKLSGFSDVNGDAVSVLVDQIERARLEPSAAEEAGYARQITRRAYLFKAQQDKFPPK